MDDVGNVGGLPKALLKGTIPIGVISAILGFAAHIDNKYSSKEAVADIEKQVAVERVSRLEDKKETNEKLNLIIRILTKTRE